MSYWLWADKEKESLKMENKLLKEQIIRLEDASAAKDVHVGSLQTVLSQKCSQLQACVRQVNACKSKIAELAAYIRLLRSNGTSGKEDEEGESGGSEDEDGSEEEEEEEEEDETPHSLSSKNPHKHALERNVNEEEMSSREQGRQVRRRLNNNNNDGASSTVVSGETKEEQKARHLEQKAKREKAQAKMAKR